MTRLRLISSGGNTTDLQLLDEEGNNLIETLPITKIKIKPLKGEGIINVVITVEDVSLDMSLLPENVTVKLTGSKEEHVVGKS